MPPAPDHAGDLGLKSGGGPGTSETVRPDGCHEGRCEGHPVNPIAIPCAIPDALNLVVMSPDVLNLDVLSLDGTSRNAMDPCGWGQSVSAPSGTVQGGFDPSDPTSPHHPVDVPADLPEPHHRQVSSPASIHGARAPRHDVRDHLIQIGSFLPYGVCHPAAGGHLGSIVDREEGRRNDVQNGDSWGFAALFRQVVGALQLIQ